ncbi:MAG: NUDIX domain-containing protein [Candidatus Saccharibacteria bacterium]
MYRRRINVRGIIYKDGKIFAQKLKHKDGMNDFWSTPGGGLDDGEDLLTGLHREMIEETGVAPQTGRLMFVQQFYDGEKEQLEFFFHITNADDYHQIDLASTSHGLIEVAEHGFIDPNIETILPCNLQKFDFEKYTKSIEPVVISNELKSI